MASVCDNPYKSKRQSPNFAFSPELAPSDFHLLGPLQDALRGTRFEDDESVIRAVSTWLREQETS